MGSLTLLRRHQTESFKDMPILMVFFSCLLLYFCKLPLNCKIKIKFKNPDVLGKSPNPQIKVFDEKLYRPFTPHISFWRLAMFAPWRSQNVLYITQYPITGNSFIYSSSLSEHVIRYNKPPGTCPLLDEWYIVLQRFDL